MSKLKNKIAAIAVAAVAMLSLQNMTISAMDSVTLSNVDTSSTGPKPIPSDKSMISGQITKGLTLNTPVNGLIEETPQKIAENKSVRKSSVTAEIQAATESTSTAATENTAPIAGLEYVILNPESIVNDQITTNTQIAWLWSYNGQDFTYDPDGDIITDKLIDGIPADSIIGDITIDSKIIGFATQFSTSAQYIMTYQVKDSKGASSNIVTQVINVEPVDGNTRPVCKIKLSAEKIYTKDKLTISWANSTDADVGDSITDLRGSVILPNGSLTDLSKYIVNVGSTSCDAQFADIGKYQLMLSVKDAHNAWSNWESLEFNIVDGNIFNETWLRLNLEMPETYSNINPGDENRYYIDGSTSLSLAKTAGSSDAEQVFEQSRGKNWTSTLPIFKDNKINFNGMIVNADGSPRVNATVKITIPLLNNKVYVDTVKTNEDGFFIYKLENNEYLKNIGNLDGYIGQQLWCWGYVDTTNKTHIRTTGKQYANYYYDTTLTLSCDGYSYNKDVAALVGASDGLVLANRWFHGVPDNEFIGRWIEF